VAVEQFSHLFEFRGFVEKMIGSAPPAFVPENRFVAVGQHDDEAGGRGLFDAAQQIEAAAVRQAEVEQDRFRAQLLELSPGFGDAAGLARQADRIVIRQQRVEALADDGGIVHDEDGGRMEG
jgi:hypothetical protein